MPDHIVDFDLYHEVCAALQVETEADVLSKVLFELRSLEEIARSAAVPFGLVPGPEHYDQAQRGDYRDNDAAYTKILLIIYFFSSAAGASCKPEIAVLATSTLMTGFSEIFNCTVRLSSRTLTIVP